MVNFEREPSDKDIAVKIINLHKKFGRLRAVNGINFNLFQGQITALLGHNGAGKSTTMSIIAGLIEPTEGTVVVNGYDILKDTTNARKSMGLCPQHDVLFPELTVKDMLH